MAVSELLLPVGVWCPSHDYVWGPSSISCTSAIPPSMARSISTRPFSLVALELLGLAL